jgi:hypothetical protein
MAAGGRVSPRKAHLQLLVPLAQTRNDGPGPISLCIPPPAATRPLRLRLQRGESDANEVRYPVRPMVARPRHRTAPTGEEGERQQADHSPHAKGQPRLGENEGQARRGVFDAHRTTDHGVRTLRDSEAMSGGNSAVCGTPSVDGARYFDDRQLSDRDLERSCDTLLAFFFFRLSDSIPPPLLDAQFDRSMSIASL